jgi:tetratricopeptide (TPR) repeat protein
MKPESIVYAVGGMFFGVLLGWVIGVQHARPTASVVPAAAQAPAPGGAGNAQAAAPPLDEGRVQALTTIINGDPENENAVIQLANTYFDAERWEDAIQWYERALTINPNNPDASTDLGVSYYYTNRPDRALAQFDHSLEVDPKHTKTMLNKGIVLAFGKEDLKAAAAEWQKVVDLAPGTPEGEAARRALEGVAAAHASETVNNE